MNLPAKLFIEIAIAGDFLRSIAKPDDIPAIKNFRGPAH
jgi:hypothetical protein